MAEIYHPHQYQPKLPLTDGALALQPSVPIQQKREDRRKTVITDMFSASGSKKHQTELFGNAEKLSQHGQSLVKEVENVKEQEKLRLHSGKTHETPWFESIPGFFTPPQIERFLRRIQEKMRDGVRYQDALSFAAVEIEQDAHGYEDEYIRQLAGLKWNIGWKEVNGVLKLQGVDYNGELLDDLTSEQEREGALRAVWFKDNQDDGKKGIESWLRTAPTGSKVLLVSPKGWSGYPGFDYPQTQIYYVEVGEGKSLKSFTLRYDVPIEDNERLQKELGVFVPQIRHERDRIKHMLGNPVFIAPDGTPTAQDGTPQPTPHNKKVHSPEDVIDLMQEVCGSSIAYEDEMFGKRTFDDMRALIRNPALFEKRHPHSEEIVHAFQEFAFWELQQGHSQKETTQSLEIALGVILVKIKQLYLGESKQSVHERSYTGSAGQPSRVTSVSYGIFQSSTNYQNELDDMSKLPGCAGGGDKKKSRLQSMGGSREVESSSTTLLPEQPCPGCGQSVIPTMEDCMMICPNDDIPCIWSRTGREGGSARREEPQETPMNKEPKPKKESKVDAEKPAQKKPEQKKTEKNKTQLPEKKEPEQTKAP